ncbi:hypothetical protein Tco_0368460 [Tanacetum coccineum]
MSMSVQSHKFYKMAKFIKMAKRLCLVDDLTVLKITSPLTNTLHTTHASLLQKDDEAGESKSSSKVVTKETAKEKVQRIENETKNDTLLIGDGVISTTPARENDELIKSGVDDLVPIPRESEMTSDREYVVDFLMENEDIADLPRHLIKQLFSYLLKHPSSTKRMFDEPLGDDSKPRSYDVIFSNPFFDFNDDFTLCNNNSLFDKEFEDISSLDPPKSAPLNYEPVEGDILFLEHLFIEETFSYPTPAVLPKKFTLLVTLLPDFEHIFLRKVERFDPLFSLTQSGGKTRVMETPSFGFHHMTSPRPAAYSPNEVMFFYYHPNLTSGDGFDLEIKKIPSDKSKAHIEVLSVFWRNRLPIPDGSLPLSR